MLTVIIGACAFVVIGSAISEGNWGTAVISAIILLILIAMAADDRKNTNAWYNMRDYWADGGSDRRHYR